MTSTDIIAAVAFGGSAVTLVLSYLGHAVRRRLDQTNARLELLEGDRARGQDLAEAHFAMTRSDEHEPLALADDELAFWDAAAVRLCDEHGRGRPEPAALAAKGADALVLERRKRIQPRAPYR